MRKKIKSNVVHLLNEKNKNEILFQNFDNELSLMKSRLENLYDAKLKEENNFQSFTNQFKQIEIEMLSLKTSFSNELKDFQKSLIDKLASNLDSLMQEKEKLNNLYENILNDSKIKENEITQMKRIHSDELIKCNMLLDEFKNENLSFKNELSKIKEELKFFSSK
ncbi:unnamed protein product, partial [Brachionus calyciflorus]